MEKIPDDDGGSAVQAVLRHRLLAVTGLAAGLGMVCGALPAFAEAPVVPVVATADAPVVATAPVRRDLSVLLVPLYFTAPDGKTSATATKVMDQADAYYRQSSYGMVGLRTTTIGWQKVTSRTAQPPCDDFAAKIELAERAARAAGQNVTAYDHVGIYISGQDCGPTRSFAQYNGRYFFIANSQVYDVIHELGHNLGLGHANTLICQDGKARHRALGGYCYVNEYGDYYDAMGLFTGQFSAPHKAMLGWLDGRVATVTPALAPQRGGRTYRLGAYERPGRSTVALRVRAGRRTFWLEARQPIGFDEDLPLGVTHGALVHLDTGDFTTQLLDMSAGYPPESSSFGSLLPGRTWTDPDGIVQLSVGTRTAAGDLPVTVRYLFGAAGVVVDGQFDSTTCAALQRSLNASIGARLPVTAVFDLATRRALQVRLGVTADGAVGPITIRALQRSVGATADGVWGPQTTRRLQLALNAGRF